jgi:N-methylhydantoinase B
VVKSDIDPVLLEILRNRFKAIVEEMASVTLRTGFTVFVKETSDFGACLVAPSGEVLSAPTETSVSLMVGLPGWEAINAFDQYDEGDVCIANDPDRTKGLSTHLPDIWLWKPIFVDGEIIAFAFNFIHSSDVGGRVPGSISPINTDIFQEGIRVPPLKLIRKGEINQDIVDLILLNCRIPDQNWGDIKAQLASLATADRRVKELSRRYGRNVVAKGITDLLDSAEERARGIIRSIPDGTYNASDYMEAEGVARPIRIELTMKIEGDVIDLDFTGTDLQVAAAFNLPTWGQQGHYMLSLALLNYFRTLDPEIPYNSGLIRPVHFELPLGTIVNPEPGLAYGVRAATFIRVMDCVMGCLAQALPEATPAASSGAIYIVLLSVIDQATGQRRITVAQPLSGGSGGRPRQDGIEGTSFTGGWLRNVPNEVLEAEMPILVEEYGYPVDRAAAGRNRGGSAIRFRFRNLGDATVMTARGLERFRFSPWGFQGGAAGPNSSVLLNPGKPDERSLGQLDLVTLGANDVVEFTTSSGGGYGDPLERPASAVRDDVIAGFVSAEAALDNYGVVLRDGVIDDGATSKARGARASSEPPATFDKGMARAEFEEKWPEDVQRALILGLLLQPSARRRYLQKVLEDKLQTLVESGRTPEPALIGEWLDEITRKETK